jgi:hypothetical protein
MAKHVWLVFTNATPGGDAEFNRWYDDIHVPDLLRIPEVLSAERSELTHPQMEFVDGEINLTDASGIGARYRYLAQYIIETDDIVAFLEKVKALAGTPEMMLTDTMAEARTEMFRYFGE